MDINEIKERMETGGLYYCTDETLCKEQMKYLDMLFDYNALKPSQQKEKQAMLKEMFAEIGENCYIETPFHSNFGGRHVHFGNDVYANFNLTLVDDCDIFVGNNVLFGPGVTVVTASHPIKPDIRKKQAQYNKPVHIGNNVWIGAGVIILPGVTIGDNSVIGASSLVTKNIPSDVIAFGSPCRIVRPIDRHDMKYYDHNRLIDIE